MANEIKVTAALECTKGSFKFPRAGAAQVSFDQAAAGGGVPGIVVVTNAAQGVAVSFTGLSTKGWLRMENIDDTAVVEWGPDDGGNLIEMGSMEPGEPALFRLQSGATLRLRSSIASSKVVVTALED